MTDLPVGFTELLRVEVGSTSHGISIGNDDHDEMGICVEPPEYVIGLTAFEQYQYRTAWDRTGAGPRTQPQPKSQPGDTDLMIYSLRKWARMALTGNPTALLLLYSPIRIVETPWGARLVEMRDAFTSQRVGQAFLHYFRQQRERLEGSRGQMRVHRQELVEESGYDRKYASHVIRLGLQGLEFLRTRQFSVPMADEDRAHIQAIRRGELAYDVVIAEARGLEQVLALTLADTPLPPEPDEAAVNRFLVDTYRDLWAQQDHCRREHTG